MRTVPLEEILDYAETVCREQPELIFIVVSVLFILHLSLWVIFQRLQLRGWKSLIPIHRFCVLFSRLGVKSWLGVFMLLPITNLLLLVFLYIRLARSFKRSYFFVVCLCFLPVIFLPILAFGEGAYIHIKQAKAKTDDTVIDSRDTKAQKKPVKITATQKKSFWEETKSSDVPEALSLAIIRDRSSSHNQAKMIQDIVVVAPKKKRRVYSKAAKEEMPPMKTGPMARAAVLEAKKREIENLSKKAQEETRRLNKVKAYNKQHRKAMDFTPRKPIEKSNKTA